jgi:hypothetical protein
MTRRDTPAFDPTVVVMDDDSPWAGLLSPVVGLVLKGRAFMVRKLPRAAVPLASLVIANAALAALIDAMRTSQLHLDTLGLISSLPPTYLLGLAALVVAGIVATRDRRRGAQLMLLYAFVFALIVWATPFALEGTPRFRTSYTNLGYVDPILRGEGLMPGHFLYHNWPLFPVAMAALIEVASVSALTVLRWFPVVMILLYAAAVVELVRILVRRLETHESIALAAAIAAWSYIVFNWTGQEYFSPQALAYLFFLGLLCVLAWVALERDGVLTTRPTIAVLGLFTLIVGTHVLTAIVSLGVLTVLFVTGHVRRWTIVLTCGLIFIVWEVTIAGPFFVFYGAHLLTSILGAGDFLGSNLESRITGDPGHIFITRLRVVASAVPFGLAALVVAMYTLRTPEHRARLRRLRLPDMPRAVSFSVAAIGGVLLVAPVSVYGGEMLIRVLFFTLPPLSAIIAMGIGQRWFRALVFSVLVVMAPVHILTHYGNELLDYVSPGEIAGFDYISTLAPANVYGAFPAASTFNTIRLDARNAYLFRNLEPASLADYADPMLNHDWVHANWPLYVAVSRGDDAAMILFQDRPGFIAEARALLDSDPNYTKVFQDSDVAVYLWKASATSSTVSDDQVPGTYAEEQGDPPLPLALFCVLGLMCAVTFELAESLTGRRRVQELVSRVRWPSVVLTLVVIAVSGYRLAELIGYIQ